MSDFSLLSKAVQTICPEVTAADLDLFIPHLKLKKLAAGETLYRVGDKQPDIAFVNSGLLRCFYVNEQGEEINTRFIFENDFAIDYKAFLQQRPGDSSIAALENAEIILIGFEPFQQAIYHSRNWERFARLMAEEVFQRTQNRFNNYFRNTPEQRYLDLLESHPAIFERVPLFQIASYLGVKRESLSRIRKRTSLKRN